MQIAHKIELKPNNKQKSYFAKATGTARFVWNWALAMWEKQYKEGLKPSGMKLKKEFNAIKKNEFPWTKEVTKYAAQQPFLDLQDAYNRYFKKLAKKPRFKKKGKSKDSFYVGGDQTKVIDGKIWVPNLGYVALKEDLRFTGKINSATFSRQADRWFVSIQVDTSDRNNDKCEKEEKVGVDLGINQLVVTSNSLSFSSPKPLIKYSRRLKRLQRKLQKRKKGSKNYQKLRIKIAFLHAKIANIRKDTLHKITTYLTKNFLHISIEDLNVAGMLKNHKLARAISDLGLGEFRRQLEYKCKIRGNFLNIADRFFPSSKTCFSCGKIKGNLTLKDRLFFCECGYFKDRDLNASLNLENLLYRFSVRPVRPEVTPEEMTAIQKVVYPIFVTSIVETGNKHQTLCEQV